MNKRVRINFKESSKAVTPDVTIEYTDDTGETLINQDILNETYELFQQAQRKVLGQNVNKITSKRKLP